MVAALLLSHQARSCSQEEMTSALKLFLPDEKSCLPIPLHFTSCISRPCWESKASISEHRVFSIQGSREGHRQLMELWLCSLRLVNQNTLEYTSNA